MKYLGLLAFLFIPMLAACGGGGDNGAIVAPGGNNGNDAGDGDANDNGDESDTEPAKAVVSPAKNLGVHEAVVITFDESMDVDSLGLDGTLAALGDGGTWSTTEVENDTLTLKPQDAWESGEQTLLLSVKDEAGNETSSETAFEIRLVFQTFQAAEVVIGQADFTGDWVHQGGPPDANTIAQGYGNPGYDARRDLLFLPDYSSNRVMAYEGVPETNNANAAFVLGQPDMTSTLDDTSATGLSGPQAVSIFDDKLVVAEYENNRVSIYDPVPEAGPGLIAVVVGQVDKESSDEGCSAEGLLHPEAQAVTPDGKLLVSDSANSRVLIWNELPQTDGAPADLVLGQEDFTSCDENAGLAGASAKTLYYPTALWTDGTRLVVADSDNNRVLIWNTFPTENFQAADVVLGQGDFAHVTSNDTDQDGSTDTKPSAETLNYPYDGIYSNGLQLFVADSNNNRVLVWNTFPTENFQAADVVLGQGDYTHFEYDDLDQDGDSDDDASAKTFEFPNGLLLVRDKLIVSDESNARYLVFEAE